MKVEVFFSGVLRIWLGFIFVILFSTCCENSEPFSIGVIADCQYCADPGTGVRKYAASVGKLKKCVDHFNTLDLAYVIHLGDFIDRDFESFEVVSPIYQQLKMPNYHVLGNHDFSVADGKKKDVPGKLGLENRYYDFEVNGWRFVALDGNDVSFHAYPEDSEQYRMAADYYEKNEIKSPKWNGAIGDKQYIWLKNVLEKSCEVGEKVVLYCHFPIFPENPHNLWNAEKIVNLIKAYPCVKAYINGHNHEGNYGFQDGVHYLTLKGMVDTEETSYAVLDIIDDQIKLNGFGRQEDRLLEIGD